MKKIILKINENISEEGQKILIEWIENLVHNNKNPENPLRYISEIEIIESN